MATSHTQALWEPICELGSAREGQGASRAVEDLLMVTEQSRADQYAPPSREYVRPQDVWPTFDPTILWTQRDDLQLKTASGPGVDIHEAGVRTDGVGQSHDASRESESGDGNANDMQGDRNKMDGQRDNLPPDMASLTLQSTATNVNNIFPSQRDVKKSVEKADSSTVDNKISEMALKRNNGLIPQNILDLASEVKSVRRNKDDLPVRAKLWQSQTLRPHFNRRDGKLKASSPLVEHCGDTRLFDERWWQFLMKNEF